MKALGLCVVIFLSACAQPRACAADARYLSDNELHEIAADSPQRLVQVTILWKTDATLEEASNLTGSFGIHLLQVVTKRNESGRSGKMAIVMFSSKQSSPTEQLARATCLQKVPQAAFTDREAEAARSHQIGRWRLDHAMGFMHAEDANRLKQRPPRAVAAIEVNREPMADISALVESSRLYLSSRQLVSAPEVPPSCERYLEAVPPPQP